MVYISPYFPARAAAETLSGHANGIAALAFSTTMLAPAGTLVVWTLLDAVRSQRSTAVGAATAIVVGLVAVTPAAGFVSPMSAIVLGGLAAFPSYFGLIWRARTSLDDPAAGALGGGLAGAALGGAIGASGHHDNVGEGAAIGGAIGAVLGGAAASGYF